MTLDVRCKGNRQCQSNKHIDRSSTLATSDDMITIANPFKQNVLAYPGWLSWLGDLAHSRASVRFDAMRCGSMQCDAVELQCEVKCS